jgi:hypothetical protein
VVPVVANRDIDDGGKRHGTALFGDGLAIEAVEIGLVANDVDFWRVAVVEMRDCICEKRAPLPGPCQAFAEKTSGPRMAWNG